MPFPFDTMSWAIRGLHRLTAPVYTDGQSGDLQIDVNGNLKGRVVAGPIINGYDRVLSPAFKRAARTVPTSLVELWGFNNGVADVYLQLHNKGSEPVNGEAPLEVFRVPAGQFVAFAPSTPIPFGLGLAWAASTTPATLTLVASGGCVLTVAYQ